MVRVLSSLSGTLCRVVGGGNVQTCRTVLQTSYCPLKPQQSVRVVAVFDTFSDQSYNLRVTGILIVEVKVIVWNKCIHIELKSDTSSSKHPYIDRSWSKLVCCYFSSMPDYFADYQFEQIKPIICLIKKQDSLEENLLSSLFYLYKLLPQFHTNTARVPYVTIAFWHNNLFF